MHAVVAVAHKYGPSSSPLGICPQIIDEIQTNHAMLSFRILHSTVERILQQINYYLEVTKK